MSPVVFRHKGHKFHFFANEGSPREPVHVHVTKDGIDAKFWLRPEVRLVYNDGIDARVIRQLADVVQKRRDEIEQVWNDFFGKAD